MIKSTLVRLGLIRRPTIIKSPEVASNYQWRDFNIVERAIEASNDLGQLESSERMVETYKQNHPKDVGGYVNLNRKLILKKCYLSL